ncbi:hypothetical protein ACQ4PT_013443 [Festuca glaucescens]
MEAMAAANSSGLTSPVGGAGAGRDGGVEGEGGDGEFADMGGLLAAVNSSGLTSPVGGAGARRDGGVDGFGMQNRELNVLHLNICRLDDEIWDVRLNLDGQDNLERSLCRSDITYMNLLALIEGEGYGINDCMYFVKEKDRGIAGMEVLDGMSKVEQMVQLYEEKKCINLTVIKRGSTLPGNINKAVVEEQIPMSEIGNPIVYTVDDDGVVLPSQEECVQLSEDSAMPYLCTQQSNNMNKGKQIVDDQEEIAEDREGSSDDMEEDGDFMEEDEVGSESDEESELNERIIDLKKRKRGASNQLCQNEEAEDIFCDSDASGDDSDCEENREAPPATLASATPGPAPPATQASSAPAPPATQASSAPAPVAAASSATAPPAAPKNKAQAPVAPPKKTAQAPAAPSATAAASPKKKAIAPSTTAAAAPKKKATAASTGAPTGAPAPFRAPRLAREKEENTRMKGYLTASNIDKLTLADIKKGL